MTIEAKKRAQMRRSRVPLGDVRRGAGGEVEMIEFNKYRDSERAPVVRVAKIGAIHRPAPGRIVVTMIDVLPNANGELENVASVHIDWTEQEWLAAGEAFRFAYAEYRASPERHDGGRRARAS